MRVGAERLVKRFNFDNRIKLLYNKLHQDEKNLNSIVVPFYNGLPKPSQQSPRQIQRQRFQTIVVVGQEYLIKPITTTVSDIG